MATYEVELDQKIKIDVKEPDRYKVIIYDDDTTPLDWVTTLLVKVFNYSQDDALELAFIVDMEGVGIVGVYTYEIAEQKTSEAIELSKTNGFQLELKVEKN